MEESIYVSNYRELHQAIGAHMRRIGKQQQLIAVLLAHPRYPFARDHMLPMVEHWHYRSGNSMLFAFAGFESDPSNLRDGTPPLGSPNFQEGAYNDVLEHLQARLPGFEFSGRTTMVLLVAELDLSHRHAQATFMDFMITFDIEGVIQDGVAPDVRTLFESLIKVAKESERADDAFFVARDEFTSHGIFKGISKGFVTLLEKYFPPIGGGVTATKAYWTFRARDLQ